jgi:hypothetical protein
LPSISIESIREAIIRQEGATLLNPNPGNLRGAPWLTNPKIVNGFWEPSSRNEGVAGLDHLIALHRAEGNTLTQFIAGAPNVYAGFAPGADGNNDPVYIANVMKWTGIPDANAPLWEYV